MRLLVRILGIAVMLAANVDSLHAQGHPAEHEPEPPVGQPSRNDDAPAPPDPSWPEPVMDDEPYSLWLFDLFEHVQSEDVDALRWDVVAWHGGDERRLWLKSEGEIYEGGGGEYDVQALYGKAISPWFDLQAGLRFEQHQEGDESPQRAFIVAGVQGLAPYRIEIEPALQVSSEGKLSLRFTASHDTRFTQRLILRSRLECEAAAQRDDEFGIDPGITDLEAGLRLRYEVRRELAPYVGVSYRTALGATRERVQREGADTEELQAAAGLRFYF